MMPSMNSNSEVYLLYLEVLGCLFKIQIKNHLVEIQKNAGLF